MKRPRSVVERGLDLRLSYKRHNNQYNTNYNVQRTQNSKSILTFVFFSDSYDILGFFSNIKN